MFVCYNVLVICDYNVCRKDWGSDDEFKDRLYVIITWEIIILLHHTLWNLYFVSIFIIISEYVVSRMPTMRA